MVRDITRVELLMQRDADPSIRNVYGISAYDYAIEAGQNFVAFLEKYKAINTVKEAPQMCLSGDNIVKPEIKQNTETRSFGSH